MSESSIRTSGSYLDIRVGKIRSDFDTNKHGSELSFFSHDEPLFETKKKELIPDDFRDSAEIKVFGFDEPYEGMAINAVQHYKEQYNLSEVYQDSDDLNPYESIQKFLSDKITDGSDLAQLVSELAEVAFGFGCDPDEIQDEFLSKLDESNYIIDYKGAETLTATDNSYAGGILLEVTPYNDIPFIIQSNGQLEFEGDEDQSIGDLEDFRDEDERFIVCLKQPS